MSLLSLMHCLFPEKIRGGKWGGKKIGKCKVFFLLRLIYHLDKWKRDGKKMGEEKKGKFDSFPPFGSKEK